MSTEAQIAANQANAQQSTGPKTEQGKAASSKNRFSYGFNSNFTVLAWEDQADFDALHYNLRSEHKPVGATEIILVEKMAQHHWLGRRALVMQNRCFSSQTHLCGDHKQLALYLRYQTTHDRAFHRCLNQLLKLRAETRRIEIGFESQKRKQTDQTRKQELHELRVFVLEAQRGNAETDADLKQLRKQRFLREENRAVTAEKAA
ncbi:MAG: hypothetical protein WB992_20850 [Bryobacteraceae bacterium]